LNPLKPAAAVVPTKDAAGSRAFFVCKPINHERHKGTEKKQVTSPNPADYKATFFSRITVMNSSHTTGQLTSKTFHLCSLRVFAPLREPFSPGVP
jgi:hypothetical protein